MYSRLITWSRYVFLAGIVLALVLVVPIAWFPFQLSKIAVLAVCLLVASVLLVVGGGVRQLVRAHGVYAALLVGLLPLVYFVSMLFAPDRSISLVGFSVESDTVVFVLLAWAVYMLSFTLFRTLRTARMLSMVVFWSLIAAAVFQFTSVVFGAPGIPLETFADRSVNLIGKWNDLGLITALLSILLFARVELSQTNNMWRIGAWIGTVLLIGLLGLINFPLAWILLLCGSVTVGLLSLIRQRADRPAEPEAAAPSGVGLVPWYSAVGAVFAVLFLLYGSTINTGLTKLFPVSSLEVRPGLQSTLDVVSAARQGSTRAVLLGTGPNTFGYSWLAHKPTEVNRTPFWNLDFNVGYSTFSTAFGSVGFLGALAWMVPLFLLGAAVVRAVRLHSLSRDERFVASVLVLSSIFLLVSIVLYVPSQNIILLAFVLSGAAFGFLWRQGRPADEENPQSSVFEGIGTLCLTGLLLVVVVSSSFITIRRFVAQAYTGAGLYALSKGDTDTALARAGSSLTIEQTADSLRLQTDAGAQKLAAIAQNTTLTPEDARAQFTAQVQSTIPSGQAAIAAAPMDYRSYYSLARVYDFLATLKVEGAYQSAQVTYAAAIERNPTSPSIPLALARMEASQGNAKATEDNITKTLSLKPDYTDAILFVVQLNVANNDLASAISNTQVAVQTAPGVGSIWFQLGLLYYAGGDNKNAVPPLEKALSLVPDYANAKYFLGLAYYQEGRQNDSLRLFQELEISNPDNTEVKTIVGNLQAGKTPLEGLVKTPPETRPTAPVNQ